MQHSFQRKQQECRPPRGGASRREAHLEPADEVEVLLHVGGQHEVYDGGAQRLAQAGRCVLQADGAELSACLTAPGLGAGCGEWRTDKQRKLTGAICGQDAGTGTAEKGGPQQHCIGNISGRTPWPTGRLSMPVQQLQSDSQMAPLPARCALARTTQTSRQVKLVLQVSPPTSKKSYLGLCSSLKPAARWCDSQGLLSL